MPLKHSCYSRFATHPLLQCNIAIKAILEHNPL